MEKTIQITIASTTFSLTERAFEKLNAYLETLKAHFAGESERAEIMRDIESRIAEKLFHKKNHVITEEDVSAITAEIGDAPEFDDDTEETLKKPASSRRLYRDMGNAWLGGVSSGIGAYFDVDPLWIRLIFLFSLIFGGAGILFYILLWALIPEAKSAGQKLEMRGKPVDVENIARVVREGVDEVRESGVIQRFFRMIGRIIRFGLRLFGYGLGTLLVLGGFFGTIGLLMGVGVITTNWNAPFNDFPLRGAVSEPLLVMGLVAGFITILIPLVAIFSLGIRLLTRRVILPSIVSFGLIGIWAIALSAGGTIAIKAAGDYYKYIETSPDYKVETRTLEVGAFDSLEINDAHVVVKHGAERSITVEGRALDSVNIEARVEERVLKLAESRSEKRMCIFCSHSSPTITVTTPDLLTVTITDGSVNFNDYQDQGLTLTAASALVRGTLDVQAFQADIEDSSMHAELASNTFTMNASESHLNLEGTVVSANITLSDSVLNARSLVMQDARMEMDESHAEVHVRGKLDRPRVINSVIINVGRNHIERIESETDL